MATIYNPDEDKPTEAPTGPQGEPLQTIGSAAPVSSGGSVPRNRKGSGRFTNLQKYLQANKSGGQQIAGRVGSGLKKEIGKEKQEATDYYGQLGRAVSAAQDVAKAAVGESGTGGYYDRLKNIGQTISEAQYQAPEAQQPAPTPQAQAPEDGGIGAQKVMPPGSKQYPNIQNQIGKTPQMTGNQPGPITGGIVKQPFNQPPILPSLAPQEGNLGIITDFTQSPEFQQYEDIRSGRGINELLLARRQQQAAKEAQDYLQSTQQAQEGLDTEGGRFNLLRKTFGGAGRPQYTTGQQRLDQALFSQGGTAGLQKDVAGELHAAREAQMRAQQSSGDVTGLASQEQGIMKKLQDEAIANKQAYTDMLQSYIDPMKASREKEWSDLGSSIQSSELTPQQLQRLGISQNQASYILDENAISSDVATRNQIQGIGDIATEGDVNRYAALAQMAGADQTSLLEPGALAGTESYTAREGLSDVVKTLEDEFISTAAPAMEGIGSMYDNFSSDYFGGASRPSGRAHIAYKQLSQLDPSQFASSPALADFVKGYTEARDRGSYGVADQPSEVTFHKGAQALVDLYNRMVKGTAGREMLQQLQQGEQ